MNKFMLFLLAAVLSFRASAAVDVTGVVAEVTAAAAPIALIGSAVLLIMVGIQVFKWVRRAM